jgi:ribosome-associated toxin RatA of RatAB toxin-antitoxin module
VKFIFMALFFSSFAAASELRVDAHKDAGLIKIDAEFSVPVSKEQAWQVMVDFEHMPQFLPQLISSHIVSQSGNHLRVSQVLSVPLSLFNYHYESVRDIDLKPLSEIRAASVGGSEAYKSIALLKPALGQTMISYHAEWQPQSSLLAGFALDTMRDQIRQQFTAMQQEMLKRHDQHAAASTPQTH